jgi:hypothetical protein
MSRFRDLFEGNEAKKEEVFAAPPAQELTPPPAKEVIVEEVFDTVPSSVEITEPETLSEEPKSFGM